MSFFAEPVEPPFAADAGFEAVMRSEEDPYRVLDDSMAAIEALCPVWPQRARFINGGRMLL